jgi:spore germination protein GerM
MYAQQKEQQDRQEQKQDKMIEEVEKAANKPTTQNILNLEFVNKKETNIDKNYGPNIEHNGGTLALPDKDKEQ